MTSPTRRRHDNGVQRWLRFWPVAVCVLGAALALGENRLQTSTNREGLAAAVQAAASAQSKINDRLREQSELNGRVDERTKAMQVQLATIIRALRQR